MNRLQWLPFLWVLFVAITAVVKIRKFRAKGQTLQEALQQAASRAASQPHKPPPQQSKGVALFLGFVGSFMVLVAAGMVYVTAAFIQKAARAPGQVVGFTAHRGSKGGYSYSPRVNYVIPQGTMLMVSPNFSTNRSFWPQIGESVEVFYDPQVPKSARLNCFAGLWLSPLLLALFGGVFLMISILMLRAIAKQGPNTPPAITPPPASTHPPGYNIPTIIR